MKKKIIIAILAILAFGMILNALGYGDDESMPAQTTEPTQSVETSPTPEPTDEPSNEPYLSDNDAYVTAQNILKKVYENAEFESYLLSDNFSVSSNVFDGFERYKVEGVMTLEDGAHSFIVTFELDHDNLEEVQTDLVEIDKVTVYDRYAE